MPEPNKELETIAPTAIRVGDHREDVGNMDGLVNSIKKNGLINPIVVDKKLITVNGDKQETEYILCAGYRRLLAVKQLKWETVEVRLYESLSDYERKAVELEEELAQKKNRSWQEEVEIKSKLHELYMMEKGGYAKRKGSRGEKPWSQEKTAAQIDVPSTTLSEDLRLAEAFKQFPELRKAGTKKDALRKMYALREFAILKEISERKKAAGEEITEDVELLNGDAYKLLKAVPDDSYDCCITDPPWGIEVQATTSARSRDYNKFGDTSDLWHKFLKEALPHIFRVLKEGSHFWLFYGPEYYQETRDALEKVGFDVRYVPCIWKKEKPNYTDTEYKPMPQYESFFFCTRRKDTTAAPRRLNEATSDIFDYSRSTSGRTHRTEKPVELIKRLISLSTGKGDSIIDPFAGSASMLRAAVLTQRKALGFELDAEIFAAANGALQNLKFEVIASDEDQ